MASSYNISDGDGRIQISTSKDTFIALQIVANSLDADVTYKLQQSEDGTNFTDIGNTSGTLAVGTNAVISTFDFTLSTCYLYITVGSATTGTVDIIVSSKKKIESEEVTATITGEVDANLTNTELDVIIDSNSESINLLRNILKEQKYTNKLLNKILT